MPIQRNFLALGPMTLAWVLYCSLNPIAQAIQEGPADFRITQFGPALDEEYDAFNPAIAYNSVDDEYLTVWMGSGAHSLTPQEFEIFGQRLDGDTGQPIGTPSFRVSVMGPDGDPSYRALDPAVAYNPTANEYLVVWWGNESGVLVPGEEGPMLVAEEEVFGRRIGADGTPLAPQFRISFMGADDDTLAEAKSPDVIYNVTQDEYFVVWGGDNINTVFVNQDFEIWGQRLDANSESLIGAAIRVSDMGEEEGNSNFTAADASVAFNPAVNEYVVAWEGDDDGGTAVDGEQEIYGQRIDASTGLEIGENDFRISFLGPEGDTGYDGGNAAVVYNPISGQYLVAWNGSDNTGGSIRNDLEIHVQRLTSTATLQGDPIRISAMGPDGSTAFWGLNPKIEVDRTNGEYVVVWRGEGQEVNNEWEVYARRLQSSGVPSSQTQRLSIMGPEGDSFWDAGLPAIAPNMDGSRFLVVWDGEDLRADLAPDEFELFGQFVNLDILFTGSFE